MAKSKNIATHVIRISQDRACTKPLLELYLRELGEYSPGSVSAATFALCDQAKIPPNPLQLRLLAWGVQHKAEIKSVDLPALLTMVVETIEARFEGKLACFRPARSRIIVFCALLALGKAMLQYVALARHVPYSKEAFAAVIAVMIGSSASAVRPRVRGSRAPLLMPSY